jgi:hypothetical protein
MKNLISMISAVSALALLASCGGGGDGSTAPSTTATTAPTTTTSTSTSTSTSADVADKYVGTWVGCSAAGSGSQQETDVISKQNATTIGATVSNVSFAAPGCSGPAGTTKNQIGTAVFVGTKTIGTSTVDEVIFTSGANVQKNVVLATATTLTFGVQAQSGGTVDADGYPTTLDSGSLTKQ